ncbi:MAG: LamG-like jellyroll fold domain-containing protein [Ignavibacteria bacterium]
MKKIYLLISICTILWCLSNTLFAQPYAANLSSSNSLYTVFNSPENSSSGKITLDSYVEIGTGTSISIEPFFADYADHRTQFFYLASEMVPLSAGPITKIAFNFESGGSNMNNFNISMSQTSNTNLSGGFVTSGLTNVYSNANFAYLGNGWQTITLQTPFNWDGTSNLVIQIYLDNPDNSYGSSHYVYGTSKTARITEASTDVSGAAGCSLTGPYIINYHPNIRIYGTISLPPAPTLLSPLNNSTNQATRITVDWDGSNTISYQLQVATDVDFTNIIFDEATITPTSKRIGPLNTSTQYFWRVNATNSEGTSDWSSVRKFTTSSSAFETDYSLSFNGTNAYVDCQNIDRFNLTNAVTVEAWIKFASTSSSMFVAGKVNHQGNRWGYGLFANANSVHGNQPGKVSFGIGRSWNSMHSVVSTSTLIIDQWYHVAGTFDGQYIKIYINGGLDNTNNIGSPYTIITPTDVSFTIGNVMAGYWFNGLIDEVSVWNIARTAVDISSTYNSSLAGNEPGLIAYYKMNDGVGTNLTDEQTNFTRASGADGTVYNATWSSTDYPLPAELTSFTANVKQRNVMLNWGTASETNNSGFGVQRLDAEGSWNEVAFVKGHGTTSTPVNYSYEDKNLTTGTYSYRLKQVDYNGNYEYFNLNSNVEIGTPQKYSISQNYPNPFNPATKIYFDIPKVSSVKISVYDVSGREVKVLVNEKYQPGNYETVFDGSMFSSGVYFYKIQAGDFTETKKMILMK